jgi:hypothetical protein
MKSLQRRKWSPVLLAGLVVCALAIAEGFQPPDTFDVNGVTVLRNGQLEPGRGSGRPVRAPVQ